MHEQNLRESTELFSVECQHQAHQVALLSDAVDLTLDRALSPEITAKLMARSVCLLMQNIEQLLPSLMLLEQDQRMLEDALVEDASER